jgi:hypothetical protein
VAGRMPAIFGVQRIRVTDCLHRDLRTEFSLMRFFLGAIIGVLGILLAYRKLRQNRPDDVGTVSEDWRAQQRRLSDER